MTNTEGPSPTGPASTDPVSPGPVSSGSVQLLTLFGIPIRVHFTFLFLVLLVGALLAGTGEPAALAVATLAAIFACLVLHELGHALVARRLGIGTREIVLLPIGGITRFAGIPSGSAELLIAAAGPAVNLAVAIGLALVITALGLPWGLVSDSWPASLLVRLVLANALIFGFNMLPAFPMDGGRILRGGLSLVMSEERATQVAAGFGQGIALLLALLALFGPARNLLLLVIALVVFFGASQEAAYNRTRLMVRGRTAREAMMTRFERLQPQDSLEWATRLFLATHQRHFPVVDAWGRVAGLVDRAGILEGLSTKGPEVAVLEVMRRQVTAVTPEAPLGDVMRALQTRPDQPALVIDGEELLGMVDLEKILRFNEVTRRLS
ncbi:MAG TPA: site-2 protease family protein [Thermoanaerobaculia bacterium]|nr:site-2 protease family protein [Thermoanaerobaculia bacterium]